MQLSVNGRAKSRADRARHEKRAETLGSYLLMLRIRAASDYQCISTLHHAYRCSRFIEMMRCLMAVLLLNNVYLHLSANDRSLDSVAVSAALSVMNECDTIQMTSNVAEKPDSALAKAPMHTHARDLQTCLSCEPRMQNTTTYDTALQRRGSFAAAAARYSFECSN